MVQHDLEIALVWPPVSIYHTLFKLFSYQKIHFLLSKISQNKAQRGTQTGNTFQNCTPNPNENVYVGVLYHFLIHVRIWS